MVKSSDFRLNFSCHFVEPNCPYMCLRCRRFVFGLSYVDCKNVDLGICDWLPSWIKSGFRLYLVRGRLCV